MCWGRMWRHGGWRGKRWGGWRRRARRFRRDSFYSLTRWACDFGSVGIGVFVRGEKDYAESAEDAEGAEKRTPHPAIEEHRLKLVLLVFLVDVEDGAVFVEGYVEGFGFFYEDVGELIFL